jgi:uncharacterized protein (UPF0333 family)
MKNPLKKNSNNEMHIDLGISIIFLIVVIIFILAIIYALKTGSLSVLKIEP